MECEFCNASGGNVKLYSFEGLILCNVCSELKGIESEKLRRVEPSSRTDTRTKL